MRLVREILLAEVTGVVGGRDFGQFGGRAAVRPTPTDRRVGFGGLSIVFGSKDEAGPAGPDEETSRWHRRPSLSPFPDTYRRITPFIVVDGAAKALKLYAEAFGATEPDEMMRRMAQMTGSG